LLREHNDEAYSESEVIWRDHPLCAPADRWPTVFWGPDSLDEEAWNAFSARLEVSASAAVIEREIGDAASVLDVGGGLGAVTRQLPLAGRRCVRVDPPLDSLHAAPRTLPADDGTPIRLVPGRAEALPFEDGSFDAVVATWTLQYTRDPGRAVAEMIRVAAPRARIVIVQAHPENPIVRCYNACAAITGRPLAHHGFLLARAAEALAAHRFTSIELMPAPAFVRLDATSAREREQLAATIVDLHFAGSVHRPAMLSRALEILREAQETVGIGPGAVAEGRGAIADHGVLLSARR
jgi:ubiquinone/menaquinone biosynthesis C-methylase UbiE